MQSYGKVSKKIGTAADGEPVFDNGLLRFVTLQTKLISPTQSCITVKILKSIQAEKSPEHEFMLEKDDMSSGVTLHKQKRDDKGVTRTVRMFWLQFKPASQPEVVLSFEPRVAEEVDSIMTYLNGKFKAGIIRKVVEVGDDGVKTT